MKSSECTVCVTLNTCAVLRQVIQFVLPYALCATGCTCRLRLAFHLYRKENTHNIGFCNFETQFLHQLSSVLAGGSVFSLSSYISLSLFLFLSLSLSSSFLVLVSCAMQHPNWSPLSEQHSSFKTSPPFIKR